MVIAVVTWVWINPTIAEEIPVILLSWDFPVPEEAPPPVGLLPEPEFPLLGSEKGSNLATLKDTTLIN